MSDTLHLVHISPSFILGTLIANQELIHVLCHVEQRHNIYLFRDRLIHCLLPTMGYMNHSQFALVRAFFYSILSSLLAHILLIWRAKRYSRQCNIPAMSLRFTHSLLILLSFLSVSIISSSQNMYFCKPCFTL